MEFLGLAFLIWILLAGVIYAGWLLRDAWKKGRSAAVRSERPTSSRPANERAAQVVIAFGLCVVVGFALQSVLRDESFQEARDQAAFLLHSREPIDAPRDALDEQLSEAQLSTGRCYRDFSRPGHPLTDIDLTGLPITDDDLERIVQGNPELKCVMLSETKITDLGLASLQRLEKLEILTLNDTRITDRGLRHLEGLQNLSILWLGRTRLTDAGLVHLAALSNLRKLNVEGTAVTDAGLARLEELGPTEVIR